MNRALYHYALARDLGHDYSPEETDKMIAEGFAEIKRVNRIDGEESFGYGGRISPYAFSSGLEKV